MQNHALFFDVTMRFISSKQGAVWSLFLENHLSSALLSKMDSTEKLLSEPEGLAHLLLQWQDAGNWRVDVTTGRAYWSRRVFEIHGLEPYDGPVNLDKAILHYHEDDAKIVAWLVMKAIDKKTGFTFTLRLRQPDGGLRMVQSVASVTVNPQTGKVENIFGIFKDVTDDISEKELSQSRSKLVNSIIRNSPSPIAVLDRSMRYIVVSPSWSSRHGLDYIGNLTGRSHYEIIPTLPESWKAQHRRVLNGETVRREMLVPGDTAMTTERVGSVMFPWRNIKGQVGGMIIMLVPVGDLRGSELPLSQLAGLMSA